MIERISNIDKVENGIFISGFSGTGNVGFLAAKIFSEKLGAKEIARVYNNDFPPITIVENRSAEIPHAKITLKDNVVIMFSEYQPNLPLFQFEISKEVVEFAKSLKVSYFISLGAMIIDYLNERPEAYFHTNSEELKEILEKSGAIENKNLSTIVGCNGLTYSYAVNSKINSAIVLVDTYRFFSFDYNGAKKLIEVLSKVTEKSVDISDIEKIVKNLIKDYKAEKGKIVREAKENERLFYIG